MGLAILIVATLGVAYWWYQSKNKADLEAAKASGTGAGWTVQQLRQRCGGFPGSEYDTCMLMAGKGIKYK